MKQKILPNLCWTALAVAVFAFLVLGFTRQNSAQPGKTITLSAPTFLTVAQAASVASPVADRLDEEAGISAWFQTSGPISISQIAPVFRTIEVQTGDYIIGSVAVLSYNEHFDAHVYAHKDGWILAYYFNNAPISKIVSIREDTITSTNLDTVISIVAGAAGEPFTQANYYDFRYPNATNILMVAENDANGNTFTINLPSTYGYFERGWAGDRGQYSGNFYVDGVKAATTFTVPYSNEYGTITSAQMLPGITHTIEIDGHMSYGVLIVTYRVP